MTHFSFFKEEELVSLHKRIKISFENQVFSSVYLTVYIVPAWVKGNCCRLPSWPDGVIDIYIDKSVDKCKLKIEYILAEPSIGCFPKKWGIYI